MNETNTSSELRVVKSVFNVQTVDNCCVTNVTSSYGPYQGLSYLAPCLVVLTVASTVGTFGNLMILVIMHTRKRTQTVETTFIVNLALADLYVTSIADPMSFIGS